MFTLTSSVRTTFVRVKSLINYELRTDDEMVKSCYPMIRTYYSVAYSCSNGIPMAIEILLLVYTRLPCL